MTLPGGPGAWLALASAALFGLSTPLAKLLLDAVPPFLLAGLLYLSSGLGLLAARTVLTRAPDRLKEAPLDAAGRAYLAAAILAGGVVAPVLLLWGLARTPAATASLLLTLEGVFTLALAWIVFRENVDRRLALGAAAILLGALLLAWQGRLEPASLQGALAIGGACLAWAVDNNLTRKVALSDPVQIAMLKGLVAGSVVSSAALLSGTTLPDLRTMALAGLVGFVAYGISLVLFVYALRHVGAARTGAYFATAPFIGAVLSVALLGEPLEPRLVLAGVLMGFGVWLHLTERHEHEHEHEALAHRHRHVHDEHHRHDHAPEDPAGEPHTHWHRHTPLRHRHPHFPDSHHRHGHG